MVTVCCICRRTKSEKGWINQLHSEHVELSHGYCPKCYLKTIREIEDFHVEAQPYMKTSSKKYDVGYCHGLEN